MLKPLTMWSTTNCGKFFKRWEYQITWPASWEICMQIKEQQSELDTEHHTGSKLGKENAKTVYCHSAYPTYMQSTYHAKCRTGWSSSWNQDCWEKYLLPQICRWHTVMAESEEELKSLLMKVKEESEKAGFKLNIQRAKIMASAPITSWQMCVLSRFSCVWLFVTPWTVAHQAPLSMRFSRQENWGGLPFPSPGDLPNPRIKPMSSVWAGGFFTTSTTWEALVANRWGNNRNRDRLYFLGLQNHCTWRL